MATWQYYKNGPAVMYTNPHEAPFKRNIDVPTLIANGTKAGLADTNDAQKALESTGFAQNDVLRVFDVPAGFMLHAVGVRVSTAEGAACTGDIGNASATQTHLLAVDADGYMGTLNLNSATTQICLVGDAHLGRDNYMGVVFVTNGTIDLTFNNACDAAIFDIWATGWKCF